MPFPSFPILLCYCTSSLAVTVLLELMLQFLKTKYGFRSQRWQYSCLSISVIFISFACSLVFVIYQQESLPLLPLLVIVPTCSLLYIFLKQKRSYLAVDINNCQKDSESIGAFWAHQAFDAYYKIVLPSLNERITSFEKDYNITFSVKKLVIVIPLSCNVKNTFADKDECIKYIDNLSAIECDQGANVNRKYISPVYRIHLNEDIYITAEYPSPLSTLWNYQSMEVAKWNYHRDCFIKTLKILVKGSPCIVAEYDDAVDTPEPLSSFLLSVLREERKYNSVSII